MASQVKINRNQTIFLIVIAVLFVAYLVYNEIQKDVRKNTVDRVLAEINKGG